MNSKKIALQNSNLYVIITPETLKHGRTPSQVAEEALKGGADILQLRTKIKDINQVLDWANEFKALTTQFNKLFIMNDFPEIANKSNADGVHLGQMDMPIHEARKIIPKEMLIGKSTHSIDQALEAEKEKVDYIGFGPIFATPTKDYTPIHLEALDRIANKVSIPYFAIGGIDLSNASEILARKASRFAVVRAAVDAISIKDACYQLKTLIKNNKVTIP